MTNPEKPEPDVAEVRDAMRALSGLLCTRCGRELDRAAGEYTCPDCYQVHCRYCELPYTARCRHQFAYQVARFETLFPEVIPPDFTPPKLPFDPPFLLDFSPEQKQEAFGDLLPLVSALYGDNFQHTTTPWVYSHTLAEYVTRPQTEEDEIPGDVQLGGDDFMTYYFARDPDAARADARRVLRAINDGFQFLRHTRPPDARYVERILSLPLLPRGGFRDVIPSKPNEPSEDVSGQVSDDEIFFDPQLWFAPGPVRWLACNDANNVWGGTWTTWTTMLPHAALPTSRAR